MKFLRSTPEHVFDAQMKRGMGAGIFVLLLTCIVLLSANGIAQGQCNCIMGDVNDYQGATALADVVYFVLYLHGGPVPPVESCPDCGVFYPACDVNGNGAVNGIDVTYLVSYYKGYGQPIMPGCCELSLFEGIMNPNVVKTGRPTLILTDPGIPDEIWLGNLTGTPIDVEPGQTVDIPIYIINDENVPALTISFTTDNLYLTPEGGTFLEPLNSWDERSFLTREVGVPAGRTTQSLLGYRHFSPPRR